MKIALLLFGQPRFVDDCLAFDSHKKAIIDRYPTDVYCHMWYDETNQYGEKSSWTTDFKVPKNAPEIIREKYKPVALNVEHPIQPDISKDVSDSFYNNYKHHFLYAPQNLGNIISQLRTIERVCDLVPTTYDLYILTRYDVIISSLPNLEMLRQDRYYIPICYADRMMNSYFKDTVNIFGSRFLNPSPFYGLADKLSIDTDFVKSARWPTPEMFKNISINEQYGNNVIEAIRIDNHWLRKNADNKIIPFHMLEKP